MYGKDVVRWTKNSLNMKPAPENGHTETSRTMIDDADHGDDRSRRHDSPQCMDSHVKMFDSDLLTIFRKRSSSLYRVVYLYIMFSLMFSNLITSVKSSEVMESVGARGHYTPTWAVHIPDGDDVANEVAVEHGMVVVGKVRQFIYFLLIELTFLC